MFEKAIWIGINISIICMAINHFLFLSKFKRIEKLLKEQQSQPKSRQPKECGAKTWHKDN
ncbi:hypothetical protein D3Z38_11775 [Clostridiales bacterium]|nr:hypothetical protein [Clostridiales bacterium]